MQSGTVRKNGGLDPPGLAGHDGSNFEFTKGAATPALAILPSQIRLAEAISAEKSRHMIRRYPKEVLIKIVQQALVYQCACPAQVCKAIGQIRELYAYQQDCLTRSDTDRAVHECIAAACVRNHTDLEQCLEDVLRLEGWDLETYEMPPNLDKLPRA